MSLRSVGSLLSRHRADTAPEMNPSEKASAEMQELLAGSGIKMMEDIRPPRKFRNGLMRDIGFTTMAGYSYAATVGIPRNPTSDVPILETTAWFMGLDGYYRREGLSFMGAGNYTITVGAEGSYRSCADHGGKVPGKSLEQSAAAVLSFSREIVSEYEGIDPNNCTVKGASRGAMVGNGIIALARNYEWGVQYADLTAPCFPRQFDPLRDTFGLLNFLVTEPQTLVSLGFQMPLSLIRRFPASIDPHPASFLHQLGIAVPLFSGEAGELARSIDPALNIQAHITTFGRDLLSMHHDWEAIFAGHPNVRVTPLKGSHLALADEQTAAFQLARNKAFRDQYNSGVPIDSHAISAVAHEIVGESRLAA